MTNPTTMKAEMTPEQARAAKVKFAHDFDGKDFHPLESIAFFRRWPRSFARNFIYTLIFNLMFAVAFTLIGVLTSSEWTLDRVIRNFGNNLIISMIIGFSFWAVLEGIAPVTRWINNKSFAVVTIFYALLGTVIVNASFFVLSMLPGYAGIRVWMFSPQQLMISMLISLIISLVIAAMWTKRAAEIDAQISLAEERQRAEAAERAALQANLRALQAQIEPHFLFNTLANVTSLIHSQPSQAKLMLENFINYLRVSLAATRESETDLAQEFELMARYLAILKIRMGERLNVDISLPPELAHTKLPPMLIQPLIENAIKHGVEPKLEGGTISLHAHRIGDALNIEIIDTGMGFQNTTSGGIGLSNVRERLAQLFGSYGSLNIEDHQPCGTRITLTLPCNLEGIPRI